MAQSALGLFRSPNYRRLWAIGALSGIARWLEFIAIGIYAYELTRSPPLVALLAMLRMLPYVLLGFLMGALADRFDRRRLLMAGTLMVFTSAATMAALVATGSGSYAAVAAATMVGGAFWTLDMPVRRRLLVDGAGEGNVAAALGFDNSTNYAMRALGPLTGGAAYQLLGIDGIYLLMAAAFVFCFSLAYRLEPPVGSGSAGTGWSGFGSALRIPAGLIFNRRFAIIMGVTLVYNLICFPFTSMVPVIAQKDFLLVPLLVGALAACDGIGGTIGAIAVGMLGSERTLFRTYFGGTTVLLLVMLGLSFHLEVTTAVVALLVIGAAAACFSATQYALVHVLSPPEVRGRATGVLSIFIGSAMAGHYLAGQLFGAFPSPQAIRIMAGCGLAAMALLGLAWLTAKQPTAKAAPS